MERNHKQNNTDGEETMFFRAAASDGSTDQYDTRQLNAQEVRSQGNGYGQQDIQIFESGVEYFK